MKKLLLTLLFLLTLCVPASFADTYSWTFSGKVNPFNSSKFTANLGDLSWDLKFTGSISFSYETARGMQFGSSTKKPETLTLKTSGINGTVTKVIVNTSGSKSPNATVGVKVGTTDFTSSETSTKITGTAKDYSFTGSASGEISINWTGNTKGAIYVKSITIEYTTGGSVTPSKQEHGLTWSAESYDYTMGEALSAPTLDNPNNLIVTYSSSDKTVATIDAVGTLMIVGAGTTTITATTEGDATYKAGSVSYTLTVIDPNAIVDVLTSTSLYLMSGSYADFNNVSFASGAAYSGCAMTQMNYIQFNKGIKSGMNNYYGIYAVKSAGLVKSVSIKYNKSPKTVYVYASNTAYNPTTDYKSSTTIAELTSDNLTYTFESDYQYIALLSNDGVVYLDEVKIEWKQDENFVASPAFSHEGPVLAGTEVTLSAAENAKIYYTTDGSDPTDQSTLYSGPIIVNDDMTVRAIAYAGANASQISEATFDVQKSLAEINALKDGAKVLYSGELTVVFASGSNVYVYDGNDYTLLYKSNLGLAAGDVIKAGWSGTVSPYNGLFEIQNISGIEKDVDATPLVAVPVEVLRNDYDRIVNADNMNLYVKIKNIEISGLSSKNFTSSFGTIYNQIGCSDYTEPGYYDVVGFVGYNEKGSTKAVQIYPASMTLLENPMIKVYWHNHNGNASIGWKAPHVHYSLDGETFEAVAMTVSTTPAPLAADTQEKIPNDWEAEIPAAAVQLFFTNKGDDSAKTENYAAIDGKHYTATDDEVTGIENIAVENATAEYFNLQGMRVAAPRSGEIYILRQGGKTSKIRF